MHLTSYLVQFSLEPSQPRLGSSLGSFCLNSRSAAVPFRQHDFYHVLLPVDALFNGFNINILTLLLCTSGTLPAMHPWYPTYNAHCTPGTLPAMYQNRAALMKALVVSLYSVDQPQQCTALGQSLLWPSVKVELANYPLLALGKNLCLKIL